MILYLILVTVHRLTLLKLSQAIGRVGVISKDEARKRELDALAYSLMIKKS